MAKNCLLKMLAATITFSLSGVVQAQSARGLPYTSQLKTDPGVGNVQGIQRYGRPLKTDPDEGEGFSYHVYPVAYPPSLVMPAVEPESQVTYRQGQLQTGTSDTSGLVYRGGTVEGTNDSTEELPPATPVDLQALIALRDKLMMAQAAEGQDLDRTNMILALETMIRDRQNNVADASDVTRAGIVGGPDTGIGSMAAAVTGYQEMTYTSPYPAPFDWTAGVRNFSAPDAPDVPLSAVPIEARAAGFFRQAAKGAPGVVEIYHQPLIQIKLRVVEVARVDGLAVGSVLEYASRANADRSLTSGLPLNAGFENTRSVTLFPVDDLISSATAGTGMLVNLTSEHINWVTRFLATEMSADIITAPEVVTLNGQNVEFVAGSKLPFALGQNVIQGTNNNIQQVFYKHVGTMVSVTPSIVNWGFHGEGGGERAVVASEIVDWAELIRWMLDNKVSAPSFGDYKLTDYAAQPTDSTMLPQIPPFDVKSEVLKRLNKFTRSDLLNRGLQALAPQSECDACKWTPDDCTLDLTLVVRLSEGSAVDLAAGAEPTLGGTAIAETNVRAIANVIQVKSGEGVVMAGLIGEREQEDIDKIPLIGDLPGVGFLFRSKQTARVKTEVLIFIEAKVLDPNPAVARAESARDLTLSQAYVSGDVLDNPLEVGMYRVGFGTYLPPHTHGEEIFWERFGRKIRKMRTHIDDTIGE